MQMIYTLFYTFIYITMQFNQIIRFFKKNNRILNLFQIFIFKINLVLITFLSHLLSTLYFNKY